VKRHRLRTMGSRMSSWKGRRRESRIVVAMDLLVFSIGAVQRLSPVSCLLALAISRRMTGSVGGC